MKKYVIIIGSNGVRDYCHVVKPKGFGKAYERVTSLGSVEKLKSINPNF
ncbi:hypothetical protein KQ876_01080 [Mycoplasma sp. CSL7491-lung]|nr:hypothetical protein [Mycoplasma sp. CSL7491-lung]MBU4692798.1 hypothetical protein [Mycoplasma sp. CSL7491-lung]